MDEFTVKGGRIHLAEGMGAEIRTDDGRAVTVLYEGGEFTFTLEHGRPSPETVATDWVEPRTIRAQPVGWHAEGFQLVSDEDLEGMHREMFGECERGK